MGCRRRFVDNNISTTNRLKISAAADVTLVSVAIAEKLRR
jgi:hypothetical protein